MEKLYLQLTFDYEEDEYITNILRYPFSIIEPFLSYNSSPYYLDTWLKPKNMSGSTPSIRVIQIDENTIKMYSIFDVINYNEKDDALEPEILTLTKINFIYLLNTWKKILEEKPPVCYLTYDEEINKINLTTNPNDIKGFENSESFAIH